MFVKLTISKFLQKLVRKGHLNFFTLISASPSYNEFILGSTNIGNEEGGGQVDFTPTYTYYNWSRTT